MAAAAACLGLLLASLKPPFALPPSPALLLEAMMGAIAHDQ